MTFLDLHCLDSRENLVLLQSLRSPSFPWGQTHSGQGTYLFKASVAAANSNFSMNCTWVLPRKTGSQLRTSIREHEEHLHWLEGFSVARPMLFVLNRIAKAEATGYQSNWIWHCAWVYSASPKHTWLHVQNTCKYNLTITKKKSACISASQQIPHPRTPCHSSFPLAGWSINRHQHQKP